jgi:hypothetical protein
MVVAPATSVVCIDVLMRYDGPTSPPGASALNFEDTSAEIPTTKGKRATDPHCAAISSIDDRITPKIWAQQSRPHKSMNDGAALQYRQYVEIESSTASIRVYKHSAFRNRQLRQLNQPYFPEKSGSEVRAT